MTRLDPNKYCVHYEESLPWALLHDIIAHPLMAITLYKWKPALDFHNFTSQHAWKRKNGDK
jgi:hypothetical protein